ncbi:Uncharacterised protein [Mycobacteroides abscessus]|nr:Uncharacterised protein [Mycobacteroides abscessus]
MANDRGTTTPSSTGRGPNSTRPSASMPSGQATHVAARVTQFAATGMLDPVSWTTRLTNPCHSPG